MNSSYTPTTADTNHLLSIISDDASAYQPLGNPTPLDYKHTERFHAASDYLTKAQRRLSRTHFTRLLKALDAHVTTATLDETRRDVSVVFELANEYELWEEFLEMFMRHWLRKHEAREQKAMRFEEWRGKRRGAISK